MPASGHAVDPAFVRKTLCVVGIVVLALALWKLAPVMLLAFAGAVLAVAIRAGAVPLSKRTGISDLLAVSVVATLALAALILGGYLFGQRIADQAQELWAALETAWKKVAELIGKAPAGEDMMENVKSGVDENALAKFAKGTITLFGAIADTVLVLFLALYFAVDPRTYRKGLLHLVPQSARERVGTALDAAGRALRKWLLGQFVSMVAVGVLTGIGLWALGVPLALPLAILAFLLDFVPIVGPIVAAVPGVLIAFAQDPRLGLYAALLYLGVQFVEGNIIMPMAEKWAVSVPPALTLLGIVGFGLLFGIIGVIFAMPLLVVTMVLVQKLYMERING